MIWWKDEYDPGILGILMMIFAATLMFFTVVSSFIWLTRHYGFFAGLGFADLLAAIGVWHMRREHKLLRVCSRLEKSL